VERAGSQSVSMGSLNGTDYPARVLTRTSQDPIRFALGPCAVRTFLASDAVLFFLWRRQNQAHASIVAESGELSDLASGALNRRIELLQYGIDCFLQLHSSLPSPTFTARPEAWWDWPIDHFG